MVELSSKIRTLLEILYELRRHKIGLVGFTILLIEIGSIIFFPLIADPAVIDNWSNSEYWENAMTPKLAPPIWVSYLFPTAPPPTQELQPQIIKEVYDFRDYNQYKDYMLKAHPELKKRFLFGGLEEFLRTKWISDKQRLGKVVLIRIVYTYKFDRPEPPIDLMFRLQLDVNPALYKDEFFRQGFGIYFHRPDGIVISLIPGTRYPKNIYVVNDYADLRDPMILDLLGIPRSVANNTLQLCYGRDWRFSIAKLQHRIEGLGYGTGLISILAPLLEEAGENVTMGQYVDLMAVLFSRADKGMVAGKSGALNGNYVFEFLFLLRLKPEDVDKDVDVKPIKMIVAGGYGLMGTDSKGRDLWTGIVYGVRWALFIGVVVATVTTILGAIYGTVSAYFGGRLDTIMQQIARVYVSIPAFPLLILLSWSVGRSIWLLITFLIVFGWMGGQFTVRSMVLQIREQTYVEAARALGASHARIVFRYVFPQVTPYLFAIIALGVPGAILTEAGLSFLGLGDPMIVTWGKILEEASRGGGFVGLSSGAWWWVLFPGLAITITSLAFIMFGQAIERIIEPRLRTR